MLSYDSALSGKDKEERSFGKSRKRPERVDTRVTVDQTCCSVCSKDILSERPSPYTRVVTDIVPARPWLQNAPSTCGTAQPAISWCRLRYLVYYQRKCSGSG
ncbi:MAG: hypothetical protein ABI337_07340 [Nitrososphaera sp.]